MGVALEEGREIQGPSYIGAWKWTGLRSKTVSAEVTIDSALVRSEPEKGFGGGGIMRGGRCEGKAEGMEAAEAVGMGRSGAAWAGGRDGC